MSDEQMSRIPSGMLVLWRSRRVVAGRTCELRCTLEQLGEGCFELCVWVGGRVLASESFPSTQDLPQRAEELRLALAPPQHARRAERARATPSVIRH